jgi:NADH-quinone oxidoreductase subunit L
LSGFYSKDLIIEAAAASEIPGSTLAYLAVLAGVFVTAFYSMRLYILVFHTEERMDEHTREHLHETPWVVTVPLVLLAIPSVIIGMMTVGSMVFGNFFGNSIVVAPEHNVVAELAHHYHGPLSFAFEGLFALPFLLVLAGSGTAWYLYIKRPELPGQLKQEFLPIYEIMDRKYGFDEFNQRFFAEGSLRLGRGLWKWADAGLIDGVVVNGTARTVGWLAGLARGAQSGYLYHYAFAMIVGLLALLSWVVFR